MYHSPVQTEPDQQDGEPAELAEGIGADAGSQRLREAHLHNGQARTRALFAPFFSVSGVGAALLTAWAMLGSVRLELIIGWIAAVAGANYFYYRQAVQDGSVPADGTATLDPLVQAVLDAADAYAGG